MQLFRWAVTFAVVFLKSKSLYRAGLILLLGTLLAGVALFYLARPSRYFRDPTLVATAQTDYSDIFATGSGLMRTFWKAYYKWRPPPRGVITFSPSATNRCSIQGLLIQCHDAIGIQFFIDKSVAAGSVMFGHTNALAGPAWAHQFTNAIERGKVEWWDSSQRKMRSDNPVFVPINEKAVLVIPSDRVTNYVRSKGLSW
jgi:hypothetical protein